VIKSENHKTLKLKITFEINPKREKIAKTNKSNWKFFWKL